MTSIRFYLFAALVAGGIVPLLVSAVALDFNLRRHAQSETESHLVVLATEVSERIAEIMEGIERDLSSLQSNPIVCSPASTSESRGSEMDRLMGIYEQFYDLAFYSPEGLLVSSTGAFHDDPAPYQEHTTWFRDAVSMGSRTVSRPTRRLGIEGLFVVVYLPIFKDGDSLLGVIRASVRFDRVSEMLRQVEFGEAGQLILVDETGLVLHHHDKETILQRFSSSASVAWTQWRNQDTGISFLGGERWMFATHVLPKSRTRVGREWILVGLQSEAEILGVVSSAREIIGAVMFVSFFVVTGTAFLLVRLLSEPLTPLIRAAREVAAKRWDRVRIPQQGPREIRELGLSFNQMAEAIQNHQNQLESKVADRTEQLKRKKTELASLNAQMRAAFESSLDGILVVGAEGNVLTMNRRFREFFRVKDGRRLKVCQVEQCVRSAVNGLEGFKGFECDLDAEDSTLIDGRREVEWSIEAPEERCLRVYSSEVTGARGRTIGRLWAFQDVTETRDLERGLQQAQKLEAVGRLAGGVAHDFNNLLAGMIGNLYLLESAVQGNQEACEELDAAQMAAKRASDLVRQMLGVARKSYLNLTSCDACSLVEEVTRFIRHGFDPRIEVTVEDPKEPCRIKVDASQLHQILMNLAVNAKDSMSEGEPGGQLTLSIHRVELTAADVEALPSKQARSGRFIRIDVSDTGTGIPTPVLDRIFEPFFTTKDPGKGTGLGLATSLGIVEQHSGWITCDTVVGEGTTFHVFLPEDDSPPQESVAPAAPPESSSNEGGEETILIVDDEVLVRTLNERFLKQLGYRVVTAVDGEDGLKMFHQEKGEIDLVLLDLTMPNMSGPETFQRLRELRPDLPVIIYTGYVVEAEEFEVNNGSRPNSILTKPLALDRLAAEIRHIFDSAPITLPKAA